MLGMWEEETQNTVSGEPFNKAKPLDMDGMKWSQMDADLSTSSGQVGH